MLYLLDANVLIRAHEDYYPIDRIPQFWDWLHQNATAGNVKIPFEIYNEIAISSGPLGDWIRSPPIKDDIVLDESVDPTLVQQVLRDRSRSILDRIRVGQHSVAQRCYQRSLKALEKTGKS